MYIPLGDSQQGGKSDLAMAMQELIDHFSLTPQDEARITEILNDNDITYEV